MNSRAVLALQAWIRALPLALAFLLPLSLHFRFYDPARAKDLLAWSAGAMLAALLLLRWLESGRAETPRGRAWLAAAAAALAAWILHNRRPGPAGEGALLAAGAWAAGPALFFAALVEAASVSFAADLADALLAAALPAALWALSGRGASGVPFGHPDLLAAFLGVLFPLALARTRDPESGRARRALAWTVSALAPAGAAASGSPAGLLAMLVSAAAWAMPVLLAARGPAARAWALAALAATPVLLAASGWAGAGERLPSWWGAGAALRAEAARVWSESPCSGAGPGALAAALQARPLGAAASEALPFSGGGEPWRVLAELGAVGAALWMAVVVGALGISGRDVLRRLRSGEEREGTLLAGLFAAAAGLVATGCVSGILGPAAVGPVLWILLGASAGCALEEDGASVLALPLPLGPGARRCLSAAAAAALAAALSLPARLALDEVRLNQGRSLLRRGSWAEAAIPLAAVSRRHPDAWLARSWAAQALSPGGMPDSAEERGRILALYREAAELAPGRGAECGMGRVQRANGRWAEAAAAFEACPEPPAAELADVYLVLGRKDLALASARAWLRREPGNPDAWRLLSEQYRERGDRRLARRFLDRASKVRDLARARPAEPLY